MQVTKEEPGRAVWLINTVFENPEALWEALAATCAEDNKPARDSDNVWASRKNLEDAEQWQADQVLKEDAAHFFDPF